MGSVLEGGPRVGPGAAARTAPQLPARWGPAKPLIIPLSVHKANAASEHIIYYFSRLPQEISWKYNLIHELT